MSNCIWNKILVIQRSFLDSVCAWSLLYFILRLQYNNLLNLFFQEVMLDIFKNIWLKVQLFKF